MVYKVTVHDKVLTGVPFTPQLSQLKRNDLRSQIKVISHLGFRLNTSASAFIFFAAGGSKRLGSRQWSFSLLFT